MKTTTRNLIVLGILVTIAVIILVGGCVAEKSSNYNGEKTKMLIFVSPQYANDTAIDNAISTYINAVKEDIGWNINVVKLTNETNTVGMIREIIKNYYNSDKILTVMMVGEDIKTPLASEFEGSESPSTRFWSELDENIYLLSFELDKNYFISKFHVGNETANAISENFSMLYEIQHSGSPPNESDAIEIEKIRNNIFLQINLTEEEFDSLQDKVYTIPANFSANDINILLSKPHEVLLRRHHPEVAISLVYPSSKKITGTMEIKISDDISREVPIVENREYLDKVDDLIYFFNKASNRSNKDFGDKISFFFDPDAPYDLNYLIETGDTSRTYCSLNEIKQWEKLGDLTYDCRETKLCGQNFCSESRFEDFSQFYGEKFKVLGVFGHGGPSIAYTFKVNDLHKIKTPLFIGAGCYTSGWDVECGNSDECNNYNNGFLDKPLNSSWFGGEIFSHPYLKVEILGEPMTFSKDPNEIGFLWYAPQELSKGKTIAEAWLSYGENPIHCENNVIYGDPTFHFARCDGKAGDIFDAVEMLEHLSGQKNLSDDRVCYYDLDNSNNITLFDIFVLINKIVLNS